MDLGKLHSIPDFVSAASAESQAFIDTVAGREDEAAMAGYAAYGIPWYYAPCQGQGGLQDIEAYRALVNADGSAWMDNTTIVTACALMSDEGPNIMTALTVWDLATFVRAVVFYERIYHHEHPNIDDARINNLLGAEVLKSVDLPLRATEGNRILPTPWDGAHRLMCDTWFESTSWLQRLHESVGKNTLDGKQIQAVTNAWREALGNPDLQPAELVDFKEVDRRWRSPSNQLLVDTANITELTETYMYLDPREGFVRLSKRKRELGIHDDSQERKSHVLSDLNLRAYVNQRLAEFFALPYACSVGRLPFRAHLYDRALTVQHELMIARVIDNRYAELAQGVQLRLPVFLALVLRGSSTPEELWSQILGLRAMASDFRSHRAGMDRALERGDLKEAKKISKALHTTAENVLEIAGKATTSAGAVILENLSKGDLSPVGTGIAATVAAAKGILKSSFTERMMWRLRRPQLLWINDLVEQSQHLTEALPDFSRIWKIPPKDQGTFVERFRRMAVLAS